MTRSTFWYWIEMWARGPHWFSSWDSVSRIIGGALALNFRSEVSGVRLITFDPRPDFRGLVFRPKGGTNRMRGSGATIPHTVPGWGLRKPGHLAPAALQ